MWGDLSSKLKFVDKDGAEIKFNSMVDAANYMVDRGWIFKQAYSSLYGGKPVNHWIFCNKPRNKTETRNSLLCLFKSELSKHRKV